MKRDCRGGVNDISICDGKEVRDNATMALARDWVASTPRTRCTQVQGPRDEVKPLRPAVLVSIA